MNRPTLSVVLAVYNEEINLGRCLQAIKSIAQEIVIVDGESTDATVSIAKSFKAKIISTPNQQNFHHMKNLAIASASCDWILQLDADEVVSPELAEEINSIIDDQQSSINGYWVNRRNWFLNRFLTKGGQYPDPTMRLYRRGKGKLPANDVHEQAKVEGQTGYLRNDLLHYRDTSLEKYLQGFNRYSTFIATQLEKTQPKINLTNSINYLFVKPVVIFIKIYIRHRGYVDGFPGFIFAIFSALIQPVAYVKYWQINLK